MHYSNLLLGTWAGQQIHHHSHAMNECMKVNQLEEINDQAMIQALPLLNENSLDCFAVKRIPFKVKHISKNGE
jgi:hypothetical protein